MTDQVKPDAILSLIRGAETSRGYKDYSRYATIAPPKPVTQMTIKEVQQWQRKAARAGSKSVAVGGYQIIGKTFNGLVSEMGLTGDELFDANMQDQMGMRLLHRRGYNDWLNGSLSDEDFGNKLAQEWAGLPVMSGAKRGRSYYAGDGLNGANTGTSTVLAALTASRDGTPFDFPSRPGAGVSTQTPSTRNLTLADIDPNTNYTGADFEQIGETGIQPYRDRIDDRAVAEAQAANTPSFMEAAGLAIDEGWIATNVARQMGREDFIPDDNFQFNEELWTELTGDLPPAYQEGLDEATSEAHARALAGELHRSYETDLKLGNLGWTGVGLRFGAALTDPIAIAASVATEGTAAPLIYGSKTSRLGRFLRAGTAAGAVNAGIDGYLTSQDPVGQWEDIAFSAAAGFVLGGTLGALRKTPEDTALINAVRRTLEETEDAEIAAVARGAADGSIGAARVPVAEELSAAERVRLENEDAPTSAMGSVRLDRVGVLKQSENGITRRLAALMGEDAVGNADGSVNVRGASENVARETRVRFGRFYREYNSAFSDWRKEQGVSWWQSGPATRARFNNEVGMAVRRELDATSNAHVSKVAARIKAEFADLLQFGREHNIRGFDEIKSNYNYMTRRFRIQALDDLVTEYGEGPINQLVARSVMSANKKWRNANPGRAVGMEEIDYEDALKVAASYIKSIRSRKYGEFSLNRALSGQDMDTLKIMLDDAGMSPEEVTKISDKVRFQIDSSEKGRISNAKWRLDLDETYAFDAYGKDGVKRSVKIEDFLENDAEFLFTQYTRSVLGAGYMEDALSNFKVKDAEGELPAHAPSFETVKAYIASEAAQKGISPNKMNSEMRMLDNLYKAVMGIPVEPPSNTREAQRFLRDYNFSRIGGQLGVAQLAEIGNILGNGGMRVFIQNMPAMRRLYTTAKDGRFSDDMLNEIEAIWGFGTDLVRTSPHVKMDDIHGGTFEGRDYGASKLQKVDFGLQQAKKATSVFSGMAHINMALQRLNARVLVQRFMDDAAGKRGINPKRLAVMGISEDMHPRIQEQLRKYVDQSEGLIGRKVSRINIHKWDDLDAKNAFINGVDRWAKKSIQENDVGNMPDFMSYEFAKTIGQFRSFMMSAYSKQFLSGLHHRDWETFSAWATSMFFGGLFYMGQTQVNSIGRADRDEYLEERLSLENIGKAAFQRAAFSSVLPMAADFAWVVTHRARSDFEPRFCSSSSASRALA